LTKILHGVLLKKTTVKILMSFRLRYRPVTVFGPMLPTVTVFRPTLSYRYLTVTDRYPPLPLLTITHRYSPFPTVTCNCEERSVTVTVGNGG
jgi:hypothetical protein